MSYERKIKDDYSSENMAAYRLKAIKLLAEIKEKRAKMEFVRVPLESGNGYYEIEKSKYEKRQRQK